MFLLVVGNCGLGSIPGTEITIGIKHVRKIDTLNNGVYLCLVRYTLCLLSGNAGKNSSVHPCEFLL